MKIFEILLLGSGFLYLFQPSEIIKGKVVDVPDGNTIELLTEENNRAR